MRGVRARTMPDRGRGEGRWKGETSGRGSASAGALDCSLPDGRVPLLDAAECGSRLRRSDGGKQGAGMNRGLPLLPAALLWMVSSLGAQSSSTPAPTPTPPGPASAAPTPTPMIDLRFIRYKISAGDLPSAESI